MSKGTEQNNDGRSTSLDRALRYRKNAWLSFIFSSAQIVPHEAQRNDFDGSEDNILQNGDASHATR